VLNDEIRRHGSPDMFCTAAYLHAVSVPGGGLEMTIARGGHPPGLIRRADGEVAEAGLPGTLLGVRERVELVDTRVRLAVGDVLVLYTDGVTERRDGTRMFGQEGLEELLRAMAPADSAGQIALEIEQAIDAFAAEPPQDDVAIIVIRPIEPA
jgi:serine phosphatase RsbU (regulator of sigma subunit)